MTHKSNIDEQLFSQLNHEIWALTRVVFVFPLIHIYLFIDIEQLDNTPNELFSIINTRQSFG